MSDVLPQSVTVSEPDAPEAPPAHASVLQSLRARREKIGAGADPLDLDVPGYGGELAVRYQWVPIEKTSRTGPQLARINDPALQSVFASADILVAACREVMIRVEGKLVPLSLDSDPVRFDPRLTDALGLDKQEDARSTVLTVFRNEYAVIRQAEQVSAWLTDQGEDVDKKFLGE